MATFTMELRTVVDIVGMGGIGLNDYPIFDESYRSVLNKRIVDNFWYREIGFETVDMFVNRMAQKMNLIMPTYNQLYESQRLEFDPLTTTKLTTHVAGTAEENSTAESASNSSGQNETTTNSKSRAVSSEFPQTQLSDVQDYASSATDSIGDSTAAGTASEEATQNQTVAGNRVMNSDTTMVGYTSTPSTLLLQFRETIINVDLAVIAELETLFMQIWNTGDEYGDYPVESYPSLYHGAF